MTHGMWKRLAPEALEGVDLGDGGRRGGTGGTEGCPEAAGEGEHARAKIRRRLFLR